MKKEKGSITLLVLTTIVFLIVVVAGMYTNMKNKQKAQERSNNKIVQEYQEEVDKMDQIYEQKVEGM